MTAWNIHSAIADWTGRVDIKASIALSAELALSTAPIASLSGRSGLFWGEGPFSRTLSSAGALLLLLGSLLALSAVTPRLGRATRSGRARSNYVYFGSLRHWDARDLPEALRSTDQLTVLSEQLVAMSRIAWRKHLLVKRSLLISAVAVVLLGFGAVMPL